MNRAKERLRELIQKHCLLTDGDFVLSTGQKSSFYFDCKRITLEGEGLTLIADLMLEEIDKLPEAPIAIGGLTMGADFVTAAVIVRAHQTNRHVIHGSIVRKERKEHGTRKKVENELPPGTKIVLVDDVVTSGNSIIKAGDVFKEEGYKVVGVIAIVDREQGGMNNLRNSFGYATALFTASEFPKLVELQRRATPQTAPRNSYGKKLLTAIDRINLVKFIEVGVAAAKRWAQSAFFGKERSSQKL